MHRSLAVVLLLAACGGGSSAQTLDDYATALVTAECKQLVRCGEAADQTSCEAQTAPIDTVVLDAAIKAHKVTFNGSAATACTTAIAALSCDQNNQDNRIPPAACAQALTGSAAVGDACALDAECASQSCDVPSCGSVCCMGTCAASLSDVALGGTCTRDADCAVGGWCQTSADDTTSTCVALVAADGGCFDGGECDYGLGCLGGDGPQQPPGKCASGPHAGDPCDDGVCSDIGVGCNDEGNCVAVSQVGAACGGATTCSSLLTCDPSGHCAAYPTSGQTCTSQCADDSVCLTTGSTRTCTPAQANGATCTSGRECTSEYCDLPEEATSGTCAVNPLCF